MLGNNRQSVVDKSEEVIAKQPKVRQSISRKSLSTRRDVNIRSPPSEAVVRNPVADNEVLVTKEAVSPKKNQRESHKKLLVANKDIVSHDMNVVNTTSSVDLSPVEIKLATVKGPRSKSLKTAVRSSSIASVCDSAPVTDSSCDESSSKRSRRQTNSAIEKSTKSGGLHVLSSDNDEASLVSSDSSCMEKSGSSSRPRGKTAGKAVAVSIQLIRVSDTVN